jgi:hypothetical protein
MRHGFVLGITLTAVVASAAAGQLPSNGGGVTGSLPPGYEPLPAVSPATGGLPAGYSTVPLAPGLHPLAPPPPADLEIHTALPANHEWRLRPENGAYFISIKSYSRPSRPTSDDQGPSAMTLAEALAREIRDQYRVQAFLFEHISEERKAEATAIAAARARANQYAAQWDKLREKAQLQGMEFLEPDHKIRYKTVNYKDQIAVLVGGFKSEEDARKALDTVRKWPPPQTKVKDHLGREVMLMDMGTIFRPGPNGKQLLQESPINPYLTATVVPNPMVRRELEPEGTKVDPFIIKLNEGRPYNLMMATKGWTLGVKSFNAPVEIVNKDAGNSVMKKFGSGKGADALTAGAEQAESMAKVLREMKGANGQPLGLEAFVLHTRTASLVTVGQFDGPNDPELLRIRQMLSKMTARVTEDRTGLKPVMNAPSLFGNLIPMPIPRP